MEQPKVDEIADLREQVRQLKQRVSTLTLYSFVFAAVVVANIIERLLN